MGTSEGKNIPGRGCSKFKVSEAEVGPVCLRKSGEARADGVEGKEEKEGGVMTRTTPRCFLFFQMFAIPENVHGTSWLAFQSRPLKIQRLHP